MGIVTKGVILGALLGVVTITPSAQQSTAPCSIPKEIDIICTEYRGNPPGTASRLFCIDRAGKQFQVYRPSEKPV